MKRLMIGLATSAVLAPTALGQEADTAARAALLLGSWTCKEVKEDNAESSLVTRFTYAANGTFSYEIAVKGEIPHGLPIELAGTGVGTWRLAPDAEWAKESMDRLTETASSFTITSAKLDGHTVDPSQAQAMWGGTPFGKDNEAIARVSSTLLGKFSMLTGSMTRCVRPE